MALKDCFDDVFLQLNDTLSLYPRDKNGVGKSYFFNREAISSAWRRAGLPVTVVGRWSMWR